MKVEQIFSNDKSEESELTLDDIHDIGDFNELTQKEIVINPIHLNIPDEKIIQLVKDGKIVISDSYKNILQYIDSNWKNMNGSYQLADNGMVLHRFSVSTP